MRSLPVLVPLSAPLALALVACPRGEPTTAPEPAPIEVAPTSTPEAEATAPAGPLRFRGEIRLPVGDPLEIFVELLPAEASEPEPRGTITIPAQMVYDGPLGEIVRDGQTVAFSLTAVGARWTAKVRADGTVESCTFEQRGIELACTLEPIDQAALAEIRTPPRPQTPTPPFPYEAIEVEYENDVDHVHLAGTLTLPPGDGPHAAALLITGSGAQDRDESLLGHKPFLVLADHLTRQGIAVLRVDDRGVGGSTGDLAQSNGAALARDVAVGVAFLRAHPRIDPARVGLVGHSEGGVLAPRVAAADPEIAFVVMMAGTGVPGHEVIREQTAALMKAQGQSAAVVEVARNKQAQLLQILLDHGNPEDAREPLAQALGAEGAATTGTAQAQIDSMVSPWFHDFVRHDPRPALRKVRCPVLVLNGTLDLQVLADQNLPEIEKALAKNRHVTVHRLEGLNHLFQHAKTGSSSEYAAIDETIAPQVLTIIAEWITARTEVGKRKGSKGKGKRP